MSGFDYVFCLICLGIVCAVPFAYARIQTKQKAEYRDSVEKVAKEKDDIIVKLGVMLLAKNAFEYSAAFRNQMVQPSAEDKKADAIEALKTMGTNDLVAALMNPTQDWAGDQRAKQ